MNLVMAFPNLNLKGCQQGAATLIMVMVLAMIMGVVALTTANIGLMEQKIVGNDLRAREAQEAAEAGLEYGVAWAKNNPIPNTVTCSSGSLPTGCPTALTTVVGSSTGESYSYILTYTKGTDSIRVTSAAQGVTDNSIAAGSEAWIRQISNGYLTTNGKSAPPLVINGGLSGVTGNPTADTGNPPGTAVLTSQAVGSVVTGHLDGNPTLGVTVSTSFPATAQPAWDYMFSTSLASATATAIANSYNYPTHALPATPAAGKEPFYVWDSGTHISGNYGSLAKPVVIIITAGNCPKINGGPTIYGIVYFAASCDDNGWGGATIYGSVIAEASITKLTANGTIIANGVGGNNTFDGFTSSPDVARLPGTWKDF